MSFSIQYRPLCVINIYHEYFLDNGVTKFMTLNTEDRASRLEAIKYSFSDFFEIVPCSKTQKKLDGQKILMRQTGASLTLLIRQDTDIITGNVPFVSLAQDVFFRFLIKVKDPLFFNYSKVAKPSNQMFLFTNSNETDQVGLPLIPLSASSTEIDHNFLLSVEHSVDYLEQLAPQETIGLFGAIELHAVSTNNALSLLNPPAHVDLKPTGDVPKFMLLFANRSTFWRYLNSSTQAVIHTTPNPNPLTKYGRIAVVHNTVSLPNPSPNMLVHEAGEDYSIMYINN